MISFVYSQILVDSIASAEFIKNKISYFKTYPFINYENNYLEWNDTTAANTIFKKLKNAGKRKVRILHIGDSHVQADMHTGYVRERLQQIFGYGGRGFVFPYAAAGTNSAIDYYSFSKGKWTSSRNIQSNPLFPIGISGITVFTNDSNASVKFIFLNKTLHKNYTRIRIYCMKDSLSFQLKLKYNIILNPVFINCNNNYGQPYVQIDLPAISDTIEFFIHKTKQCQKYFLCYGMSIETQEDKGILYSSVGINGAGLKSIIREKLLSEQLISYAPDLLIIDLGANDFYNMPFNDDELTANLMMIIKLIKYAVPNCNILITNSQSIFGKYTEMTTCNNFSMLTRNVALKNNCLFYDYYKVSGGYRSMQSWFAARLAKNDRIHLNYYGYQVKGELLLNAMLASYLHYLDKKYNYYNIHKSIVDSTIILKTENKTVENIVKNYSKNNNSKTTIYIVSNGDCMYNIAKKFNVNIEQIQSWNKMKNNNIYPGMKLKIIKK